MEISRILDLKHSEQCFLMICMQLNTFPWYSVIQKCHSLLVHVISVNYQIVVCIQSLLMFILCRSTRTSSLVMSSESQLTDDWHFAVVFPCRYWHSTLILLALYLLQIFLASCQSIVLSHESHTSLCNIPYRKSSAMFIPINFERICLRSIYSLFENCVFALLS